MKRNADLLEIIRALHTPRRFPRRLNCGEQQPDQNTDDRDNHQQLDEGKAPKRRNSFTHLLILTSFKKVIQKEVALRERFPQPLRKYAESSDRENKTAGKSASPDKVKNSKSIQRDDGCKINLIL